MGCILFKKKIGFYVKKLKPMKLGAKEKVGVINELMTITQLSGLQDATSQRRR